MNHSLHTCQVYDSFEWFQQIKVFVRQERHGQYETYIVIIINSTCTSQQMENMPYCFIDIQALLFIATVLEKVSL